MPWPTKVFGEQRIWSPKIDCPYSGHCGLEFLFEMGRQGMPKSIGETLLRVIQAGVAGAIVVLAGGCASISGSLPAVPAAPAHGELRAGAAKLDITPPPGFAMGGHSVAGQVSRGHWLRLQARSIFLESPDGAKLVMVSADLWSFPAGLGDRIAEIAGSDALPACRLRRDQLILAATHTHQSPGNFSSSVLYNSLASKEFGFDAELFEFLAGRIAGAVHRACENAIPASLRFGAARVGGLARNRSIEAFLRDPEANDIISQNADLPEGKTSAPYPDARAFRAIYPLLQTLWFADARDPARVIAAAAFVAVHPTAMSHDTPVYSSDIFGVAATHAEQTLAAQSASGAPVVAIFNGAEGDVSPIWYAQDRVDTLRVGELLGKQIIDLEQKGTPVSGDLNHRFEVKQLADGCFADADGHRHCATPHPVGGPAALGGAEDGRTWLYDLGCKEGVSLLDQDGSESDHRGVQRPNLACSLAYGIARLGISVLSAPTTVPMGVYRVGRIVLVTLPGEFTTVMGYRIRQAVGRRLGPGNWEVIVIGLANEYVSYFTTPEEFAAQHYEGGSTLYGQYSASLVMDHAGNLAGELATGASAAHPEGDYHYSAGVARQFSAAGLTSKTPESLEKALREVMNRETPAEEKLHQFCWKSPVLDLREARERKLPATPSVWIETLTPSGQWEKLVQAGIPEDDRGPHFLTALAAWDGADSEWCSFWFAGKDDSPERLGGHRFAVLAQDGSRFDSEPF